MPIKKINLIILASALLLFVILAHVDNAMASNGTYNSDCPPGYNCSTPYYSNVKVNANKARKDLLIILGKILIVIILFSIPVILGIMSSKHDVLKHFLDNNHKQ